MKLTRLCASGAKHYTVHELPQGMQVHVYTYMYIQTQKHFHLHSLTELEKSSQRLSPRTHLYMHTHVHMYMHVQCVSHMSTNVDLEYIHVHVHMELPFLPRHPSVYMSPVICPVETALILLAQTPFWASSQSSGCTGAIHVHTHTTCTSGQCGSNQNVPVRCSTSTFLGTCSCTWIFPGH